MREIIAYLLVLFVATCHARPETRSVPAAVANENKDTCIKSFPTGAVPHEDMMMLFYLGDAWYQEPRPVYSEWIGQTHDALPLMRKLWSFIARFVSTGFLIEIIDRRASPKPNCQNVKDVFEKACNKDASVITHWPFNCISHEPFCELQEVLKSLLDVGGNTHNAQQKYTLLAPMYSEQLLKFASHDQREDVVYVLARNSIEALFRDGAQTALDHVSGEIPYVEDECNANPNSNISRYYFCRLKAIFDVYRTCKRSYPKCIFHSNIQEYFSKSSLMRGKAVEFAIDKTKTQITDLYNAVHSGNGQSINSLVNSYDPFVTVDVETCKPNFNDICTNVQQSNYPLCHLQTLYRFDCTMQFILTQLRIKPFDDERSTVVKIWLAYPTAVSFHEQEANADYIKDLIFEVQKVTSDYITRYDNPSLKAYASYLPPIGFLPSSYKTDYCMADRILIRHRVYCYISPILDDVALFLNIADDSNNPRVRTVVTTVNYVTLIGQMQLERVQAYLTKQVEHYVGGLSGDIQENFASLSNYFSSIAEYDSKKYLADIEYIKIRLGRFKTKITTLTNRVETLFATTLKVAIVANTFELANRAYQLGVAVAKCSNPVANVFGSADYNAILDRIDALAQAGVDSAILGRLGESEFPELKNKAIELGKAFSRNAQNLTAARLLVTSFTNNDPDLENQANEFLNKYKAYDPQVQLSDITAFGAQWQLVAQQVCEAAFAGDTVASALVEIGLASSGECNKVKIKIAELITVYEAMYQYQFDLMDSLSDAARAFLAEMKANAMKEVYNSEKRIDEGFLSKVAVRSYIVSIIHVWKVVTEYCNVLTYKNGGEQPEPCRVALETPTHGAVADVMSLYPPEPCKPNNQYESFRAIPVTKSDDGVFIDLDKLYKGETVTFAIPDTNWLKNSDWLSRSITPKAIYVTRFEVYLPPMTGDNEHSVRVQIEPNIANYLMGKDGVKYLLQLPLITNSYKENIRSCYKPTIDSPYDSKKLCPVSYGLIEGNLRPSIFNEWRIKVTDIPDGEAAPQVADDFKLQAVISYCLLEESQ